MINLLPPDLKESITYARRNTKLLHWCFSLVSSIALVGAVVAGGHFYIAGVTDKSNRQLAEAEAQLQVQKVDETQKRVEEISSSLKLVVQVLSKEVLFSDLLQQIGAAMPANTILTDLNINKPQGGIDLKASATDQNFASQVQVNLSDPKNKIFSKADLISITCSASATTGAAAKYPCAATLRAQFSQNNPFLFINSGTKP